MQSYVGTKVIQAEPAEALNDGSNHKKGDPGYRIVYPDGYISWSPKAVFEECYRELAPGEVEMVVASAK